MPSHVRGLTKPALSPTRRMRPWQVGDLAKSTLRGNPLTGPSNWACIIMVFNLGLCARKWSRAVRVEVEGFLQGAQAFQEPMPTLAAESEIGKTQPYPGKGTSEKCACNLSDSPSTPSKYPLTPRIKLGTFLRIPILNNKLRLAPTAKTTTRPLKRTSLPRWLARTSAWSENWDKPRTRELSLNFDPLAMARLRMASSSLRRGAVNA